MKKLVALILVLTSITFTSCSKDDSPSEDVQEELFLKFTYDGQNYNFNPATVTSLQKNVTGMQEINSVLNRLDLWMPVNSSTGSYNITDEFPTESNLTTLYNAEFWIGDATYVATSGTLVITAVNDEYITGTFNFTAEDDNGVVVVVTDGSFNAYK